jgi:hypothetical protein
MANLKTTFSNFDVFDYKGENVLSSYALSATPLVFVPDLPPNSNHDVVWSFGDGTTSKMLCASKYYNFPGTYTVNLVVYDCANNASVSVYSQNIIIHDYIPYTFNFTNLSSTNKFLTLQQSKIHGPWNIESYFPLYQPVTNINYVYEGSNSVDYFSVADSKFAQLQKTYAIFDPVSNYYLSATQYKEVPVVTISNPVALYAKIQGNSIVNCSKDDISAFFVGLSALNKTYFKDDSVSNGVLRFKFDSRNNHINGELQPYLNNTNISLSVVVTPNNSAKGLTITSNGLDGEGALIDTFNISPVKFNNIKIPFVIKIKDVDNFSLKNFNELSVTNFSVKVLSASYLKDSNGYYVLSAANKQRTVLSTGIVPTSYYTLSSINDTMGNINHGGSARAYIKFNETTSSITGVQLSASAVLSNINLSSFTLSGTSGRFDVLPKGFYDIYKVNENFNASETLNDLAFQENIKNNPVFFEDFIGTIMGSTTYDHDSLGVKTYEGIENFVMNNRDIDTENIKSIISDTTFLNVEDYQFDKGFFNYPEKIKRITNLASIKRNKLKGITNKFDENFDTKGQVQKTRFGINLGNQINTSTYAITAGVPIVALEKFGNEYVKLNTYQPLCAGTGNFYKLSAYTSDWGWPLVLPSPFKTSDFEKYYLFFEYNDQIDGTVFNNVIDFTNSNTTIISANPTTEYLVGANGVFETMFLDVLYQSLSL